MSGMRDITVEIESSLAQLTAETEAGEAWLQEELGDPDGLGQTWSAEAANVEYLASLARRDGLRVIFN